MWASAWSARRWPLWALARYDACSGCFTICGVPAVEQDGGIKVFFGGVLVNMLIDLHESESHTHTHTHTLGLPTNRLAVRSHAVLVAWA